MITLLNECCMSVMKRYEDNYFDLAVVDPPYFEGPNRPNFYRNGKYPSAKAPAGQYKELSHWEVPKQEYFEELKRVSKNQIIWGANHFASNFDSSSSAWIVWDKDNGKSSFADAELAYSSFKNAVRIFKFRWNGMLQGYNGNKSLNEKRIHPTQKPIELYEWLYENYAKKNFKILDTHLGSASSAIAALRYDLDFVGCDIDTEVFQLAQQRFKDHENNLQGALFYEDRAKA